MTLVRGMHGVPDQWDERRAALGGGGFAKYDDPMRRQTACILDGGTRDGLATNETAQTLAELLAERGWEETAFRLRDLDIAPCRGCFACWVQTPGVCIIDDVAREIARTVAQSELLVFLTPVTFGGYSSELKKALDRLIPLILPHFQFVNSEVHHVRRYPRYPSLLAVGLMPRPNSDQERIFAQLTERNAINLHAPSARACLVPEDTDEKRRRITKALDEAIGG